MMDTLFSRFKWYRRMCGGEWWYYRIIWDFGRNVTFGWMHNERMNETMFANIKVMEYEKYE